MTISEILLRLTVATLVGGALGMDRELRDKPAGMRTHALVALGASLVMVTTLELTKGNSADPISRAIQGIIAGVGFLGAGAILRARNREEVSGLTTAASIWLVASLGIACGAGHWVASISALVLALIVLVLGAPFERVVRRVFPYRPNGSNDGK